MIIVVIMTMIIIIPNNIIPRVLFSGGHTTQCGITFSHAKEHAYQQSSLSPSPPPQQGCRRCALLSSIAVFVIIFIVIVIIVIIAISASRSLLSAATQHITRACVEGHHNKYCSLSPPSRPVQGSRRCPIFYLISVLMDSGFRVIL